MNLFLKPWEAVRFDRIVARSADEVVAVLLDDVDAAERVFVDSKAARIFESNGLLTSSRQFDLSTLRYNRDNGQIEILGAVLLSYLIEFVPYVYECRQNPGHPDRIRQLHDGLCPVPVLVVQQADAKTVYIDEGHYAVVSAHDAGCLWYPCWINATENRKAKWRYLEGSPYYREIQRTTGLTWAEMYDRHA